jgi:tetratricopeptide (TPR) repeat protein
MPCTRTHSGPPTPKALRTVAAAVSVVIAVAAAAQTAAPSANEATEVQRLIKDGQHAQALKLIDDSLAKNPKDANMRFRRGVVLSLLDRKNDALAVFQKLVEDHPDMPAPYNNMAVLYGAQGEYEKARGSLERAIRTNPAYATAYQNLGDVYAQLASQAYSKALQLDKTDATVPPKLALLRELASSPTAVAAAVPTATVAADKPAAAAPAAPPPAPPATAAPPAKPTAVPASANQISEVEAAVRAWASAWSKRDVNAYYAAYAPDFVGQQSSRKAWEEERRERIVNRKRIRVDVSQMQISINGDQAQARFRQSYSSDSLDVTSRKTLELVRSSSGRWQIRRESVSS